VEFLVTYDIATADKAGQRRLNAVAKACEGFGVRVQYSVFECRLSEAAHQLLVNQLLDLIDPAVDQVSIYQFPGRLASARETLGCPPRTTASGLWLV
jgi:CRISPR-associated protein Cas2